MKIKVSKDSEWFLAEVEWHENIFAHGWTEIEAKQGLLSVMEMMLDFHLEQVEQDRKIKNAILKSENITYAV